VSDPPALESAIITLDDYMFHYEILVGGELMESWTGKAFFRNPGAANVARVLLPLTDEIAKRMTSEAYGV
jgi:hypothetical protein